MFSLNAEGRAALLMNEEIGFVFLSFGGLVAAAPHGSAKGKRTKTKTNQFMNQPLKRE